MIDSRPIGVLDSGVGGLSVWQEIVKTLPRESTIYIADSKNCPYGNRSKNEIYRLSQRLVNFLLEQHKGGSDSVGAKLIVIACNTITVSCLDKLRRKFKNVPIIGIVPVIKTAAQVTKNKRIGILSTTATSKSWYQRNLIQIFAQDCTVFNVGTDRLVPFIEKGDITSAKFKSVLGKELEQLVSSRIDTLALGCSHFPFVRREIEEIMGSNVALLSSQGAIARQVKRVLRGNNNLSSSEKPQHFLYTTGNLVRFKRTVRKLINENLSIKFRQTAFY